MEKQHDNIVIFDICDTLFTSNTTFDFLTFYIGTKTNYRYFNAIKKNKIIQLLNAGIFRIFHVDLIRKAGIKFLAGKSRAELLSAADSFYDNFLQQRKRDKVFALLKKFQEQNIKIYLVSATLDFIAETIGRKLNIENIFSTQLLYHNGICAGKINQDMLGKKEALLKTKTDLKNIQVVTDNLSDKKLVQQAKAAYIISSKKNTRHWRSFTNIRELIICE